MGLASTTGARHRRRPCAPSKLAPGARPMLPLQSTAVPPPCAASRASSADAPSATLHPDAVRPAASLDRVASSERCSSMAPSSHTSVPPGAPARHTHPASMVQLAEQPSPDCVPPSSHCSTPRVRFPSPHTDLPSCMGKMQAPASEHPTISARRASCPESSLVWGPLRRDAGAQSSSKSKDSKSAAGRLVPERGGVKAAAARSAADLAELQTRTSSTRPSMSLRAQDASGAPTRCTRRWALTGVGTVSDAARWRPSMKIAVVPATASWTTATCAHSRNGIADPVVTDPRDAPLLRTSNVRTLLPAVRDTVKARLLVLWPSPNSTRDVSKSVATRRSINHASIVKLLPPRVTAGRATCVPFKNAAWPLGDCPKASGPATADAIKL
mmetsp:Transcript_16847/g.63904  ORF Transcript_16847/g.63904 Transcript_16847/m.63904 type:complete len:384 (-) Transcript_16847:182-1333(-)